MAQALGPVGFHLVVLEHCGGCETGDDAGMKGGVGQRCARFFPSEAEDAAARFIVLHTPFATQHSVKGAQFENVLVILGGGWNHYNWPRLLDILQNNALTQQHKQGFFRARNLLYVALSRPQKRLAVLATQTLGNDALATASRLFGAENVHALEP